MQFKVSMSPQQRCLLILQSKVSSADGFCLLSCFAMFLNEAALTSDALFSMALHHIPSMTDYLSHCDDNIRTEILEIVNKLTRSKSVRQQSKGWNSLLRVLQGAEIR